MSFQHTQVRIIPFENIVCIITIIPLKVYDTKGISLTSYHKNVNFVFWKYEFCLCLYHCFIAWNKDINIEMSLTVRFIFSRKICTRKLNHTCLFTYESRGIKYLKHQAILWIGISYFDIILLSDQNDNENKVCKNCRNQILKVLRKSLISFEFENFKHFKLLYCSYLQLSKSKLFLDIILHQVIVYLPLDIRLLHQRFLHIFCYT